MAKHCYSIPHMILTCLHNNFVVVVVVVHVFCVYVFDIIACDDARIRVWRIPDDGSRGGTQNEEEFFLIGTIITSPHTYSNHFFTDTIAPYITLLYYIATIHITDYMAVLADYLSVEYV